jgi:hypothetical protein
MSEDLYFEIDSIGLFSKVLRGKLEADAGVVPVLLE